MNLCMWLLMFTSSLPGPASTMDSFCHCSSDGPGTASPLPFSSLAPSFAFFFAFFFTLFFFFFLSFCFARFFLPCRLFFVLESLSLESSEEELEEEEDEEELVDEDAVSEEEVLAFLFFLSFRSFFFSAIHKKRLRGAALASQQEGCQSPPPSLLSSCPSSKAPPKNAVLTPLTHYSTQCHPTRLACGGAAGHLYQNESKPCTECTAR